MINNYTTMVFLSFIGVLFILLALLNKLFLRWIGIKPMSEVFTNPKFQRSAKITEKLGRLLFGVLGVSFLVQGVGAQFLSSRTTYVLSLAIFGLAGLILLVMFGVILANWKAK